MAAAYSNPSSVGNKVVTQIHAKRFEHDSAGWDSGQLMMVMRPGQMYAVTLEQLAKSTDKIAASVGKELSNARDMNIYEDPRESFVFGGISIDSGPLLAVSGRQHVNTNALMSVCLAGPTACTNYWRTLAFEATDYCGFALLYGTGVEAFCVKHVVVWTASGTIQTPVMLACDDRPGTFQPILEVLFASHVLSAPPPEWHADLTAGRIGCVYAVRLGTKHYATTTHTSSVRTSTITDATYGGSQIEVSVSVAAALCPSDMVDRVRDIYNAVRGGEYAPATTPGLDMAHITAACRRRPEMRRYYERFRADVCTYLPGVVYEGRFGPTTEPAAEDEQPHDLTDGDGPPASHNPAQSMMYRGDPPHHHGGMGETVSTHLGNEESRNLQTTHTPNPYPSADDSRTNPGFQPPGGMASDWSLNGHEPQQGRSDQGSTTLISQSPHPPSGQQGLQLQPPHQSSKHPSVHPPPPHPPPGQASSPMWLLSRPTSNILHWSDLSRSVKNRDYWHSVDGVMVPKLTAPHVNPLVRTVACLGRLFRLVEVVFVRGNEISQSRMIGDTFGNFTTILNAANAAIEEAFASTSGIRTEVARVLGRFRTVITRIDRSTDNVLLELVAAVLEVGAAYNKLAADATIALNSTKGATGVSTSTPTNATATATPLASAHATGVTAPTLPPPPAPTPATAPTRPPPLQPAPASAPAPATAPALPPAPPPAPPTATLPAPAPAPLLQPTLPPPLQPTPATAPPTAPLQAPASAHMPTLRDFIAELPGKPTQSNAPIFSAVCVRLLKFV